MKTIITRAALAALLTVGFCGAAALAAEKKVTPAPVETATKELDVKAALIPGASEAFHVETMRKLWRSDTIFSLPDPFVEQSIAGPPAPPRVAAR
jgi:hypothetical protein